ncbi:MAG: Gfo/Idh/MocA family oxidoreductase [Pseudomonadota bacterium]
MTKSKLHIGLIGSGFMGRAHAFGYGIARQVFDLPAEICLHGLADYSEEHARAAAKDLGFRGHYASWQELIADSRIDIVDITTPNHLHAEIALSAIKAGKHVYCEKPLATCLSDSATMREAARAARITTQVGSNYLANPLFAMAREMVRSGALGEVRSFRGIHAEDYMADASMP